jgi:hypothetical protein
MAVGTQKEGAHPILCDRVLLYCVKGNNSAPLEAIQEGIVP